MTTKTTPNRLIHEKSPYLLQHAHNPVDWFSWSNEAFDKAKAEEKPIFLSIGYSTCHWCHVMERESFEDDEVAALLNKDFVSIKVDREERPDLDNIYMSVCQLLSGSGGWPITVFLTPDKKPFFAGTYFPKTSKYGRIGLLELLPQISRLWREERERLHEITLELLEHLKDKESPLPGEVSEGLLDTVYKQLSSFYDDQYGGFGGAPKFPVPHNLLFLLRYGARKNNKTALKMADATLKAMYKGGIYDHLGFGFSRYATDERWLIPHFEKMLYDNALLLYTYSEAYQALKKPYLAMAAAEITKYLLRDMRSPEGYFYSAEDADSEGVEGKFYLWTPEEVKKVLGQELGQKFCKFYNITERGNFEGKNILNRIDEEAAQDDSLIRREEIEEGRKRLFLAREQRIHPFKDKKVLTGWNGLAIAALARAALVLGETTPAKAAEEAASFLFKHLRRPDGRLLARYHQGEAKHPAYAEDYAYLIWGLIELYQAVWKVDYLKLAIELHREFTNLFWDQEKGGFFFYGSDGEQLLVRNKEIYDGATPSANSVASTNTLRLAGMTGNEQLQEQAEKLLEVFAGEVAKHPGGHCFYLLAVDHLLGGVQQIVMGIPEEDPLAKTEVVWDLNEEGGSYPLLQSIKESYLPRAVILGYRSEDERQALEEISETARGKKITDKKPTVYVCHNYTCQAPVTEAQELQKIFKSLVGQKPASPVS